MPALDVSDDALARLRDEAHRRGVSVGAVVDELVSSLPAEPVESSPRKLGFVALGRSTSGRSAVDSEDMLAEGFGRD